MQVFVELKVVYLRAPRMKTTLEYKRPARTRRLRNMPSLINFGQILLSVVRRMKVKCLRIRPFFRFLYNF